MAVSPLDQYHRALEMRKDREAATSDHNSSLFLKQLELFKPVAAAWAQIAEEAGISSVETGTSLKLTTADGTTLELTVTTALPNLRIIYWYEPIGLIQSYMTASEAIARMAFWAAEHTPLDEP